MEKLRRASKKEKDTIGRVKPNGRCKRHPKHRQSPGVCSLCLREKLTQLSAFSSCRRRRTTFVANDIGSSNSSSSSLSSLSSYYSSSSASSCASPVHCFRFSSNTEGKSNSLSIFLLSGQHGIVKSKSLGTVVPRRRGCEGGAEHGDNRSGFCWFNLFRSKSKRIEDDQKDTKEKMVRSMSILLETRST